MAKTRSKPSHYSSVPFHAIRFSSFLASLIVSGILIYFCYQLKNDGFKLPWTFLIVLAASLLNLIVLLLTTMIHCCGTLSPIFNLVFNIPILIMWLLGLCLLCWNMFGTLAHTCTIANWASNEGVMICQIYKALFSFTVIGTVAQIAQVALDGTARRKQTRLGKYDKMNEPRDLKAEAIPIIIEEPPKHDSSYPLQPMHAQQYRDEAPGWRPGPGDYTPQGYANAQEPMTMDHFTYQAPARHTHYDAGSYTHGEERRGNRAELGY